MILQAALRLFLDHSFDKTTMRRIADAVEYTPGALYSYFKDKDEILYALHTRGFEKFMAMQRAELLDVVEPMERLRAIGRVYVRFGLANPEYYHLMFIARSTGKKIVEKESWDPGMQAYMLLRDTMAAVIDTHGLAVDPDVASYTCWSAVHGMVSLMLCDRCVMMEAHLDLDVCVDQAYGFLMQLFEAAAAESASARRPETPRT